jgi:N-acetylneuraminic acid mutarotase
MILKYIRHGGEFDIGVAGEQVYNGLGSATAAAYNPDLQPAARRAKSASR